MCEPVSDKVDGKDLEPYSLLLKLGVESIFTKHVTTQKKGGYVSKSGMLDQKKEQIDKLGR